MRKKLAELLFLSLALVSLPIALKAAPAANAANVKSGDQSQANSNPAWVKSCKGEGAAQVCDVVQSLVDTQTGREAVRFAIAKQKSTGNIGVLIKVPLGLRLDTGVAIRADGVEITGLSSIKFNRCLSDGCYAESPISQVQLNQIKYARDLEIIVLDLAGNPKIVKLVKQDLAAKLEGI